MNCLRVGHDEWRRKRISDHRGNSLLPVAREEDVPLGEALEKCRLAQCYRPVLRWMDEAALGRVDAFREQARRECPPLRLKLRMVRDVRLD